MDRGGTNFDLLRLLAAWLALFGRSDPIAGQPMATMATGSAARE